MKNSTRRMIVVLILLGFAAVLYLLTPKPAGRQSAVVPVPDELPFAGEAGLPDLPGTPETADPRLQEVLLPAATARLPSDVPVLPAVPVPDLPEETATKKIGYRYGIEDATGQATVRSTKAKVGVDYNVSQTSSLGVEAGVRINDAKDAAAWDRSVKEENEAQVKYKVSF